jgi:uncharacterized membrane protein HdeD (DUF308 family)
MATNTDSLDLFRQVLTQAFREHWVAFLIEGIVLVMLGVLAILVPMIATTSVAILIGWLILISGVVGLVTTLVARDAPGFWWSVVSAIVSVVAGIMLLRGPILEEVSLTLLLVVLFTIEGATWSAYALEYKKELSGPWTWMLMSGVVDLIMAFMIWCRLPGTAAWAFGLLVATSMLFGGASMIAMAVHARSSPSARKTS